MRTLTRNKTEGDLHQTLTSLNLIKEEPTTMSGEIGSPISDSVKLIKSQDNLFHK